MKFSGEQFLPGKTSKRLEEDHFARYQFLKKMVRNSVILDVACGTGYGTKIIKKLGAKSVYGLDISKESIKYAKKNYAAPGIKYFLGSADKMPFIDEFFDLVVSFETIEHLNDQVRTNYLKEIHRVLKSKGILVISTPNKNITSPFTKQPLNKYHFREYQWPEFLKILTKSGFNLKNKYGQRMINNIFAVKIIRILITLVEKIFKINFRIYDHADGPKVKKIKIFNQPRYYVGIFQKVTND